MPPKMQRDYCPYCGEELSETEFEGRKREYCPECDRIIWKNASPVAAVIVAGEEEVLLVKRGIKPGKGEWSLPAGFLEYEENAKEAAIRELEEETGIVAEESDLDFVDSLNIERFPDQRLVATVFKLDKEKTSGELEPGSDAEEARFCKLEDIINSEEVLRDHFISSMRETLDSFQ